MKLPLLLLLLLPLHLAAAPQQQLDLVAAALVSSVLAGCLCLALQALQQQPLVMKRHLWGSIPWWMGDL
jgi:hypothetical protein